jgi:hypothetical protein
MNTFLMIGANFERMDILDDIQTETKLCDVVKKKLPNRIYNFRNLPLPYYCKDITLEKLNTINLYKLWESSIGTYVILVNGVKKGPLIENSIQNFPSKEKPKKKMKIDNGYDSKGSSFVGSTLFDLQSYIDDKFSRLRVAFGFCEQKDPVKDLLEEKDFKKYSFNNCCSVDDYRRVLRATLGAVFAIHDEKDKIVGRCVAISKQHIITAFHVVQTENESKDKYLINPNLFVKKKKLSELKLTYPPLEYGKPFTDIAIFDFEEEILQSHIKLFHESKIEFPQSAKLLKPVWSELEVHQNFYLCHKNDKTLGDHSRLHLSHYEKWFACYSHLNGTVGGYSGSSGFTFYPKVDEPYFLLIHRFGMLEFGEKKTKIGGGIRIDLFLEKEFGNLNDSRYVEDNRLESWNWCRELVVYLLNLLELNLLGFVQN